MMFNPIILFIHAGVISGLTLIALRFGKELLIAWLTILSVAMNLFVLKQINLFGLSVTSSDALAVGYLLGLNLTQEYFGRETARKTVWICFFAATGFVLLSQIHLLYQPNRYDMSQEHFVFLLFPMPRLLIASFVSFLCVQLADISFFAFLSKKTEGKFLALRVALALVLSQLLDTLLFTFLGLYGLIPSVGSVIAMSLMTKGIVIALSTPFVSFSKKMVRNEI